MPAHIKETDSASFATDHSRGEQHSYHYYDASAKPDIHPTADRLMQGHYVACKDREGA